MEHRDIGTLGHRVGVGECGLRVTRVGKKVLGGESGGEVGFRCAHTLSLPLPLPSLSYLRPCCREQHDPRLGIPRHVSPVALPVDRCVHARPTRLAHSVKPTVPGAIADEVEECTDVILKPVVSLWLRDRG